MRYARGSRCVGQGCDCGMDRLDAFRSGRTVVGVDDRGPGRAFDKGGNLADQIRRGVLEHDVGLVLDGDQFLQPPLADHPSLENDPDMVANLLHLFQQVGAEKHGDAPVTKLEDQVTDLP